MRLLIIRHGDPDYVHDSLTEKGIREATLLAERLKDERIDYAYVSPLGRAALTAKIGLSKTGITPITKAWLREFDSTAIHPDQSDVTWDWFPAEWSKDPRFYSIDTWMENDIFKNSPDLKPLYEERVKGIDELLLEHGYKRSGRNYEVINENRDTLALFCHFGVMAVLLSHLINCSPMVLWHGFVCQPTGVTILSTEERQKGIASWRISRFGDLGHLDAGKEKPSFAGRFRETYGDGTDDRKED